MKGQYYNLTKGKAFALFIFLAIGIIIVFSLLVPKLYQYHLVYLPANETNITFHGFPLYGFIYLKDYFMQNPILFILVFMLGALFGWLEGKAMY